MLEDLGILSIDDEELEGEDENVPLEADETKSIKSLENISESGLLKLESTLLLNSLSDKSENVGSTNNEKSIYSLNKRPQNLSTFTNIDDFDKKFCSQKSKSSSVEHLKTGGKRASVILQQQIQANSPKSITTIVVETLGVGHQGKQMFALYNVRILKTNAMRRVSSSWNVIRRYSDFHTFNAIISQKVCL